MIPLRIAYLDEDYQGLPESQKAVIQAQLPDYFQRHLGQDLTVFLAEENGEIAAVAFLLITEMPANPHTITGRYGTMLNVYTKPPFRRRGIAETLLRQAIGEGRARSLSYLELDATQAGLPLYRKLNFTEEVSRYTGMIYPLAAKTAQNEQ